MLYAFAFAFAVNRIGAYRARVAMKLLLDWLLLKSDFICRCVVSGRRRWRGQTRANGGNLPTERVLSVGADDGNPRRHRHRDDVRHCVVLDGEADAVCAQLRRSLGHHSCLLFRLSGIQPPATGSHIEIGAP